MKAITAQPEIEGGAVPSVPSAFNKIFVVRNGDLDRIATRIIDAKMQLRLGMSTIWDRNSQLVRDAHLQQLSNLPQIREGLTRLAQARQKNQATPELLSGSEQNEKRLSYRRARQPQVAGTGELLHVVPTLSTL